MSSWEIDDGLSGWLCAGWLAVCGLQCVGVVPGGVVFVFIYYIMDSRRLRHIIYNNNIKILYARYFVLNCYTRDKGTTQTIITTPFFRRGRIKLIIKVTP